MNTGTSTTIKTEHSSKSIKELLPFLVTVTLVLGFLLGIITTKLINVLEDENGLLSQSQSQGSSNTNQFVFQNESGEKYFYNPEFLKSVYDVIDSNFIGDIPSEQDLTYGLVKGLISSLDSKYTFFLTPEEAKEYEQSKDPSFEGIGVTLRYNGEYTQVESVIKGNPAYDAGIMSGDLIVEVDGVNVVGEYPAVVAQKIRGPKDTTVKVKLYRQEDGLLVSKDFEITRKQIDVANVTWKENPGTDTVTIEISQFNDVSAEAFNDAWDKVVDAIDSQEPNLKGVVVDLRNNPGGYVYSVRHVLEEFLNNDDVLLVEETKDSDQTVYTDERNGSFEDVPMTVLVNEGSASASEIFAGAIQDHERGKIVGEPTVGKGVEQVPIELDDGSLLILVFQKWLTPDRKSISEENPIKPDYEVEFTDESFSKGEDPQLEKAIELLK